MNNELDPMNTTPIPTTSLTAPADEGPSSPLISIHPYVGGATPSIHVATTAEHRGDEAKAEADREKVVDEDANRTWHGELLKPWSEARQRLLDQLTAADVPLPDTSACDDATFYHGFFPWAVKALFLALHEPRDWEPHRPRLLAYIEAWGAAEHYPAGLSAKELETFKPERLNVPADDITDKAQAVNLAVAMVGAHRKIMAQRRVMRRMRGPATEGN